MTRAALFPILFIFIALSPALACRPRACDTGKPLPLQVLATSSPGLNPDDKGEPWALNLRIYEVKAGAELDDLEFEKVFEADDKAFGEATVKRREESIFPERRQRWTYELDPQTTHVVTVGLYREPLGDAWYQTYAVPKNHHQRVCEAQRGPKRKRKSVADPCLFLALEDQEIRGGRFPPAGFDVKSFEARCAPVAELHQKKKKKKRRRRPSLPTVPDVPRTPQTPQTPTLPSAPQAPTAPSLPSAPQAPTAPKLPH